MPRSCGAHVYLKTCADCKAADATRCRERYHRADRPLTGHEAPCAGCGKPVGGSNKTSPRPGRARFCHTCRRVDRTRTRTRYALTCEKCGVSFESNRANQKFCGTACQYAHSKFRTDTDHRVTRSKRERSVYGLGQSERKRLLTRWRKQGRVCVYCRTALATTIDHVIPLIRGGTNHEGNLAPCCRRCNSSKCGWLVVEWRTGVRRPEMRFSPELRPAVVARVKVVKPALISHPCAICAAETTNSACCSLACGDERNRRNARDRYRAKVGLPVDPSEPTRGWAALCPV